MKNSKITTTVIMEDSKSNETQVVSETEGIGIKNPLLINLVVSSVMKNLDVKDLTNCRLVNIIWNLESTPFLKNQSLVRFNATVKVSEYLAKMMHFGHTNFYYYLNYLNLDTTLELKIFFRFLKNQIKSLSLCVTGKGHHMLETFKTITENTPNLEELKMDLYVALGIRTEAFDQEFLSTYLNVKPLDKVRKLTLNCQFCADYDYLRESNFRPVPVLTERDMARFIVKLVPKLESLVLDRNSNSLFSSQILKKYFNSRDVQEVTISDIFMYVHNMDQKIIFQVLLKWPILLTKLKLHLEGPHADFDSKNFHALLNRHCSTLEELKIDFQDCCNLVQIQINTPKFPKLRKLNITKDGNDWDSVVKAGQIDFRFDSDLIDLFPLLNMEGDQIFEMFSKLREHHSSQ